MNMNINASIIIPAYNEERRMKPFLKDLRDVLRTMKNYELIFVNDGSTDKTKKMAESFLSGLNLKIITYSKNRGKGYALMRGVSEAKGDIILFIDADGSIPPKEIPRLINATRKHSIAVGSRTHPNSKIKQPLVRMILGKIFNKYIELVFGMGIDDTLIGFKAFRKAIAKDLFLDLKSHRWLFDIEILYKAKKKGYEVRRIPIIWSHKDSSKIKFADPIKMALEALYLRARM
jgi:glycosyltransferase involved in cell wall biosynthesis